MALRSFRLALRLAALSQSSRPIVTIPPGLEILGHPLLVFTSSLAVPYSINTSREYSSAQSESPSRPRPWPRDVRDYNRLIALVNLKKCGQLHRTVYDDMLVDGVQPVKETFALFIDGCMKEARLQDVIYFFEEMKAMGLTPDVTSYNHVITSYGKAYHVTRAIQVVADMEASGILIRPRTYLVLLRSCAVAGRLDDAYEVVRNMAAKGLSLNDDFYTALILAHKNSKPPAEGAVQKILEILEQSKQKSTEDLMAAAATGESDVSDASGDCLATMLSPEPKRGAVNRRLSVYHAAVKTLSALGEMEATRKVLKLVETDGHVPDTYCVMELMKLYLQEKDFEKACGEFYKYVESGQTPTLDLFLLLIEGGVTNATPAGFAVARRILTELSQKGYFLNAQIGSKLMLKVCHPRSTDFICANLIWDMMRGREFKVAKHVAQEYHKALQANFPQDDPRLIQVKGVLDAMRKSASKQKNEPSVTTQAGGPGQSSAPPGSIAESADSTEGTVEALAGETITKEKFDQPTGSSDQKVESTSVSDETAQSAAAVERVAS